MGGKTMTLTHYVGGKLVGQTIDFPPSSNYPENTTFINSETFEEFIFDGVATWNKITPFQFNDTGLKAYYKFNAVSSPIPNESESDDSIGINADMTISGGATFGVPGIIGDAVLFNGSSGFGELGSSLTQWQFTYAAGAVWSVNTWVKNNVTLDAQGIVTLIGCTGPTNNNGFNMTLDGTAPAPNTNRVFYQVESNNVRYIDTTPDDVGIDDTNFHMWTMTYDFNTGDWKLYFDSVLFATVNDSSTPAGIQDADEPLKIAVIGAGNDRFYNASYDETSIWNRVLPQSDIDLLFNGGAGLAIYD